VDNAANYVLNLPAANISLCGFPAGSLLFQSVPCKHSPTLTFFMELASLC